MKCKDYEIEGDLNNPLWILCYDEKRYKVAIDGGEYEKLIEMLKALMKENFELKLEKAILSEFPIDYEDVKAVVLEEMKKNPEAYIEDIIEKVKLEHPNLFYEIDFEKLF